MGRTGGRREIAARCFAQGIPVLYLRLVLGISSRALSARG